MTELTKQCFPVMDSSDIESKIMAHTFAIQQDFIENKPTTYVLNSILEAVIRITNSDYGFIAQVSDEYFIPIATSGIDYSNHKMDNNMTLVDNFNKFMETTNKLNSDKLVKFIPITDNIIIGLISSNKLHLIPDYDTVFEPLMIVCRALLKKNNTEKCIEIEKGSIISYIAHELRTPLTNIMGSIVLLKESTNEKIRQEYINIIEQSNSEFVSIINDTIDYSKLLLDKIKLKTTPVILKDVINSTCNILKDQLKSKKINLKYHINKVPSVIDIDGIRFQQMMINIISSVINLLLSGGKIKLYFSLLLSHLIIKIKVSAPDNVEYSLGAANQRFVEDIHKDLSNKLQSRESVKIYAGIDLGLEIAKKLINLFSGSISIDKDPLIAIKLKLNTKEDLVKLVRNRDIIILSSNVKIRICMFVCLKNMQMNCTSVSTIEEAEYMMQRSSKFILFTDNIDMLDRSDGKTDDNIIYMDNWNIDDIENTNLVCNKLHNIFVIDKSNVSILVVEDNKTNRHIIIQILNVLGWTNYNEAENGQDALNKLASHNYKIVLMDMNMPIMDGKTATLQIHKLYGKTNRMPYLIALTANDDYIDFYIDKMNGYILKPITSMKLLDDQLRQYKN